MRILFFYLLLDLMKSKDVLEAASASKHPCHLQSKYSNFRSTLSHLHSSLACCKDILLQNIVKGIIYLILIDIGENFQLRKIYSLHPIILTIYWTSSYVLNLYRLRSPFCYVPYLKISSLAGEINVTWDGQRPCRRGKLFFVNKM